MMDIMCTATRRTWHISDGEYLVRGNLPHMAHLG
jgi:hypothetical protein